MKRQTILLTATLLAAVGLWTIGFVACAPAFGQEITPGQTTTQPADTAKADPAKTDPAAKTDDDASVKDDLASMLDNMTPEQLAELIKKASLSRLTNERQQVAAEINDGLLFIPEQKAAAVKELQDNPANTQKDNVDRICKAFAKVDERFAKPYKLYTEGKYTEAAEGFKKIVNAKESSYFSAARHYLWADSLAKSSAKAPDAKTAEKLLLDATDAYIELLEGMVDRVSFASIAAVNTAEAFEKAGRGMKAMQMYMYCVKNFALTLDKEQVDNLVAKMDKLQEVYKDPMDSVAKLMRDVKTRLDAVDSGKDTQKKEQDVVALLEELIKMAEEQRQPPPPRTPPTTQPGGERPEPGGSGTREVKRPAVRTTASTPGLGGILPPSVSKRLPDLEKTRTADDSDIYSPPRVRDAIREAGRKVMSERYQDIIRDYYRRLAQDRAASS